MAKRTGRQAPGARALDLDTLNAAAIYLAGEFRRPTVWSQHDQHLPERARRAVAGREYSMQTLYNADFLDEHLVLVEGVRQELGARALADFNEEAGARLAPRDNAVYERLLRQKHAIDPDGNHIKGARGSVELRRRVVGHRMKPVVLTARLGRRLMKAVEAGEFDRALYERVVADCTLWMRRPVLWPVFAGEEEERARIASGERGFDSEAGEDAIDPDPDPLSFAEAAGANNPRISNEAAIAACDAIVDLLDEGSTAATIRGRTGSQPAGADETESGTLLFTLTMSDPAFNAASDAAPGGQAAADTISDDASADATGTLGYCRAGATGTGADDHIDGEAGTSSADFIFNTLSIVSGAVVSMSSFTVTVPES